MAIWKILITDGLAESGKAVLKANAEVEERPGLNAGGLAEIIGKYEALVVRSGTKVTEEVLEAGERLKVVGRAGVGVDNIDLAAAQARGVTVVNSPMATTNAVAEHTLALMLALVRQVARADAAMKSGQWLKKELKGSELGGKTLGILGMGRIGAEVGKRAAAFGMEILGYDPLIAEEEIRKRGAEPVSKEDLFRRSDFVSLHMPLTPETRGMIDGQALASMKRGVHLICTARGGLIDETGLLARLESGQVAGAALDVFENEPPGLTALVAHPNVIATPHIAAQTTEAQERAAVEIAEEVLAALNDKPLRWKIV